ncbi:DUF3299 domain-containing protein [Nitrincola tapanii]|uniref:DUF3299 domain-containing protein n=1 Tax=Nitrincola tapanii TaxID=1708751 RepID=A0A5A9W896_9GAMM|nr:DUF3299 domain-containing protein [Nitrincola tapanii]KAA0876338.1 DUF3299 domain-containing protein [Nitrincola tapanii]
MTSLFRSIFFALVFLSLTPSVGAAGASAKFETLEWDDLMPEDYTLTLEDLFGVGMEIDLIDDFSPEAERYMENMLRVLASAPVREDMDQRMIRIPGFVVPLEGEGNRIYRFFLVPYFGACIHVPPPPSNQIIDVKFEPGTQVESLYDAVWISGRLTTQTFQHDLGTSGYHLEAFVIEPYIFEDDDWDESLY